MDITQTYLSLFLYTLDSSMPSTPSHSMGSTLLLRLPPSDPSLHIRCFTPEKSSTPDADVGADLEAEGAGRLPTTLSVFIREFSVKDATSFKDDFSLLINFVQLNTKCIVVGLQKVSRLFYYICTSMLPNFNELYNYFTKVLGYKTTF